MSNKKRLQRAQQNKSSAKAEEKTSMQAITYSEQWQTHSELQFTEEWRHNLMRQSDVVCLSEQKNARYLVGFAVSKRSQEEVYRLRYRVFNEELGEGLPESKLTGMDYDALDDQMTHLVVVERVTQEIVGTYRLQSITHGLRHKGIYSAQEYDLTELAPYFPVSAECGRACIAPEHRSASVLLLMWGGLRDFLRVQRQRWIIGCCSLTTQDPMDGWRAHNTLQTRGMMHSTFYLPAMSAYSCGIEPAVEVLNAEKEYKIPKLFSAYMRLGAQVISEPAIDREFKTVDFLIMLDAYHVNYSSLGTTVVA
jgi:putative hemolysin